MPLVTVIMTKSMGTHWSYLLQMTRILALFGLPAIHNAPRVLLVALALGLAACGGGGGDDDGNPPDNPLQPSNQAPTADAGADQTVAEATTVNLLGTGSDPEGSALSFSWAQSAGVTVTLDSPDSASASFIAPAAPPGGTEVLQFQLTVSDGQRSATDTVAITVQEPQPTVEVSGRVSYEFVPANNLCGGLDFNSSFSRPIRQATVQLLDGSNAVIASTTANDSGDYVFADVTANTEVRLRIRAELKNANWDVEVRDNFDDSGTPPALSARPLYVVDSTTFNTGGADVVRNLTAPTGWGGSSYTGDRAAAPFAILDAIYTGMQLVLSVDAAADFSPLDAFWSVNNTSVNGDIALGEIGTSFYTSNPGGGAFTPSLFLLGDAATDTEEFDSYVVVHEWGHYFEDNFSRSDSIGGAHSLGQSLDARVAFGEGFATALAAMALGDPQYCDTGAAGTQQGFGLNAETFNPGVQGWFNEVSVVTMLYDLFDTANDGADTGSIGFGPIYETLVGPQAATEALTTVFSFATELRPMLDADGQALLDALLEAESINSTGLDIWASNANNDAGDANGSDDALPLFTPVSAGSTVNICTNKFFDTVDAPTGNKLAQQRYLSFIPSVTSTYEVEVLTETATPPTTDPDDRDQSDPDVYVYDRGGIVAWGFSAEDNREIFTTQAPLAAGNTYILDLEEWRFDDSDAAASFPDQICFDVTLTAN